MRFFLFSPFYFLFSNAFSQEKVTGVVFDKSNQEPLAKVSVLATNIATKDQILATSNSKGSFTFQTGRGEYTISYRLVGYHSYYDTVFINSESHFEIYLSQDIKQLNEVTISAQKDFLAHSENFNELIVPQKTILNAPRLSGEVDVMKTIQLLPGIKQGSEGNVGLYVRGGDPGQNLLLLDGVPMYNFSHLFGFLSVVNPESLKDISIKTGGISGRYEGRLSSVIDISMKEGDKQDYHNSFSLSPIAGNIFSEGPLKKGKSSYVVSARRTWLDAIGSLANLNGTEQLGYNFHDFNAKLNFNMGKKNKLIIGAYNSRDKFYSFVKEYDEETGINFQWNNLALYGHHTLDISPKVGWKNTVYSSGYEFKRHEQVQTEQGESYRDINTSVNDHTLKSAIDYSPNKIHNFHVGFDLTQRSFNPEFTQSKIDNKVGSVSRNFSSVANMYSFFLEDDFKINRFRVLGSVRQTLYRADNDNFFSLQPHLLLNYSWPSEFSVKASYDRNSQFIHLLTNSTIGEPIDLWLPAKAPPLQSNQFVIGGEYYLKEKKISFGVDAYWKNMQNVIEYQDGASYLYGTSDNWDDKITVGQGTSYGLEFFMGKESGPLTGWVSYTLAKSTRQFDDLNNGEEFPYKYDRTHDLNVMANYRLNKRSSFSATFTCRTGNTVSLPVATYQSAAAPFWDYGASKAITCQTYKESRNNFRLPSYHRLDLSYQNTKKLKKGRERIWAFSIYNTYNKMNPYYIYEKKGELRQYAMFPVIPSISYKLMF
ncbi:MAG: TonB-dependent receptor [Cytophagales bacterium]|nr:TonB-dependent receptor [Cytophagales bacterium]